jgi:hypothetical protein
MGVIFENGFFTQPNVQSFTFTLTSDSFDHNGYNDSVCGNAQGQLINFTGITITDRGDSYCGINAELSGSSLTEITNLWTSAGIIEQSQGYMFNVTWGPGSTIQNGVVKVGFYTGNNNNNIRICPIDESDVDYLTSGAAGDTQSINGTFNFPATFTLITPQIPKGGWC